MESAQAPIRARGLVRHWWRGPCWPSRAGSACRDRITKSSPRQAGTAPPCFARFLCARSESGTAAAS